MVLHRSGNGGRCTTARRPETHLLLRRHGQVKICDEERLPYHRHASEPGHVNTSDTAQECRGLCGEGVA